MFVASVLRWLLLLLRALLITQPQGSSWWTVFLVWLVRLVTFSLLLRTYIFPWTITRMSKHLRIRSISLRSIRGLYARFGAHTLRADRISWTGAYIDGSWRITLQVHGFVLQVGIPPRKPTAPIRTPKHSRSRTLAAKFAPSPIAHYLWRLVSQIFFVVDPFIRPVVRTYFTGCLRLVIGAVPGISQALVLDLHSPRITFAAVPGAQVVTQTVSVRSVVAFQEAQGENKHSGQTHAQQRASYSLAAWRRRFTHSVQRSWDRACATTHGAIDVKVKLQGITGSNTSNFIQLPGSIDLIGSFGFSPRRGSVDPHSVKVALSLTETHVEIGPLLALLKALAQDAPDTTPESLPPLDTSLSPLVSPGGMSFFTSPISPTNSRSPLLSAFTGTMVRRHHPQNAKLKDVKDTSILSFLSEATFRMSRITVSVDSHIEDRRYNYCVNSIDASARISRPERDALHRRWLGAKKIPADPEGYVLDVTTGELRANRDSLHLLSIKSVSIRTLAVQWPPGWLHASPFLSGDPNAPFLAVHVGVGPIRLTERLDCLLMMTAALPAPAKPETEPEPATERYLPRVALELECQSISGTLVVSDSASIGLRTDGFVLSVMSQYTPRRGGRASIPVDAVHLHLTAQIGFALRPTFVRVCSGPVEDPVLLSMESFEVTGHCRADATLSDDSHTALVYLPSRTIEVLCTSDALCVELWHPLVVQTLLHVLSALPAPTPKTSTFSVSQLPKGVFATFSLARFVVFVTAPDLNPDDTMDLARGFAVRAVGLAVQFCSLRANPEPRSHWRSATRQMLYLPPETLIPSVLGALRTNNVASTVHVSLTDLAVRSAVSTQFEADDPLISERDAPGLKQQEFLALQKPSIVVALSSGTFWPTVSSADNCSVTVTLPSVKVSFQLAHLYSVLLGASTVHKLAGARRKSPIVKQPMPSSLHVTTNVLVKTVHLICALPAQSAHFRWDGLSAVLKDKAITASWERATGWVKIPASSTPKLWAGPHSERWEELLSLRRWTATIDAGDILIDADAARIRIPHGFVLADLVLDISLCVKSIKHLGRICLLGEFSSVPFPEAEAAKHVPKLTLNIRALCVEAADDPFETRLGLASRVGLDAAKSRKDRDEAFQAKVNSILAAESSSDFNFTSQHSVSISDARERLAEVHSVDWIMRLNMARQRQAKDEDSFVRKQFGVDHTTLCSLIEVTPPPSSPPLLRALFTNISLNLSPPSFPIEALPSFLHKQGGGLPVDMQFSLLVPLHLNFGVSSLRVTLRDYPLPLAWIPPRSDSTLFALDFDGDLVIAEEMCTDLSVDWVECPVVPVNYGMPGSAPFALSIPKTIMPVKSYANPVISVSADDATVFTWGVSYGFATQDVMRVVDTLSSAPRDASPAMGFWDKMRLIFHWTITTEFANEVRLQMKGSRDPYLINGEGAGFVLAWRGKPRLCIGERNDANELVQIISDSMLIAIPDFSNLQPKYKRKQRRPRPFKKVCATFSAGVCFGIGFVMERSCGPECVLGCSGSAFHRQCRLYTFRPHYEVKMERKPPGVVPERKGPDDSYNGFRSDFIHLSVSLTSALKAESSAPSSLHLTPLAFTHFWSWWKLFDGVLSLPVRQGLAWPHRPISPKFGRHLATIKYRIGVRNLYIMHGYIDDSRETWADGLTPWVGVKGFIDHFQVDMHQREEEKSVDNKIIRRKPFYAVELAMQGIDLRALLAVFDDPMKAQVGVGASPQRSNYLNRRAELPQVKDERWCDAEDFVELDWAARDVASGAPGPALHFLPVGVCPRFTYFRRGGTPEDSKFGDERSHTCFLGKEPSVPQVQVELAKERLRELSDPKMSDILKDYIKILENPESPMDHNYHLPADSLSESEWAEFDNVFQVHCPKLFLDSAVRDIMVQYYYCSRARKGQEYHMAARAVQFIRDQAEQALHNTNGDKHGSPVQGAAQVLKKILTGADSPANAPKQHQPAMSIDPASGWSDGVSLEKAHCCLLLKPQIVLRDEWNSEQSCVVAAVQAKLQSYTILDDKNVDDPINGKIMSRTYTTLSGLQTFTPESREYAGDGCVPLEVLIDFRCDTEEFQRLVPQTDAAFHYDKFNRLRLRNNVVPRNSEFRHLQDQTDLIQVHIPKFTVTANDAHFQIISRIVTKLILFSDAALKTRTNKLETLLFTYDFKDLFSVAGVVKDLQTGLRDATETEDTADLSHLGLEEGALELLKLKAHKMLLSEELNALFDCIQLAQDERDQQSESKSSLLLHTSSSEISWRMLDEQREMLAKLVVQDIDFWWLSRQDSSSVNDLSVGNLQAFDGAQNARWAEILCKYDEPANHPLLKKGIFVMATWSVLAPVGGITIYESFELNFHPMRLQVDARVGRRIMEYVWPDRRNRKMILEDDSQPTSVDQSPPETAEPSQMPIGISASVPALASTTLAPTALAAPMRLSASRSFTDLRSATLTPPRTLHRTASSGALRQASMPAPISHSSSTASSSTQKNVVSGPRKTGDAAEMKTRSSQKSFVLVRISSLNLLLSVSKEQSFVCRDAHIRTRDLEYRNQTWSFEELVNQFIPSDMSWKGWLKMAFHQPLVPVLPVARELISKTKWIAGKAVTNGPGEDSDTDSQRRWKLGRRHRPETPPVESDSESRSSMTQSHPPMHNKKFATIFGRNRTGSPGVAHL